MFAAARIAAATKGARGLISPRRPPIAGPATKPTPKAAPTKPKLRARSSGAVMSAIAACAAARSEEHTSELQSLMRISYAVFCLKKKKKRKKHTNSNKSEQQYTTRRHTK